MIAHHRTSIRRPRRSCAALIFASFSLLFRAGTDAAEAPPSLSDAEVEAAFAELSTWDDGRDDGVLHRIAGWLERSAAEPRARSLAAERLERVAAGSPAAPAGARRFALARLRLVAGPAQVPALERLLPDASLSDLARAVLEAIPGEESLAALRRGLASLEGRALAGVVGSLGARRDAESAGRISALLGAPDPDLREAAAAALGEIATPAAAAALAGLPDPSPPARDALLRAAERLLADGKRTDAEAIWETTWRKSTTGRERAAALAGLAAARGEAAVPLVLEGLGSGDRDVASMARRLATRLPGPAATRALIARMNELPDAGKAVALAALGERGDPAAEAAVLPLAETGPERVRIAAIRALGRLGGGASIAPLARVAAASGGELQAAARASLSTARGPGAEEALLAGAASFPAAERTEALRAVADRRTPGGIRVLTDALRDERSPAFQAALEGLVSWPAPDASSAILAIASRGSSPSDDASRDARLAALSAALRLTARTVPEGEPRTKALGEVRKALASGGGPALLVEALRRAPSPDALELAASIAADPAVPAFRDAAVGATLDIAERVAATHPQLVISVLGEVLAASPPEAVAARAKAIVTVAERRPSPEAEAAALTPDLARSRGRKKELAALAPQGSRLVLYLDCGPDLLDGKQGRATLRLLQGGPWLWAGAAAAARAVQEASVAYHGDSVVVEASGLRVESSYELGFTWWDYDGNGRLATVWASRSDGTERTALLERAELPAFAGAGRQAEERRVAIPRGLRADGSFRVGFRNERGPNAVVGEVWVLESGASAETEMEMEMETGTGTGTAGAPPAAEAAAGDEEAKPAAKEPAEAAPRPAGTARVLIVTGIDYPGHLWRETAPVLKKVIAADPRLRVEVVEEPAFLASERLHEQDVVVLHFMNWETPDPGPAARENLRRFVAEGKGLVLVHFACGAFQDWPEFRNLAGRAYDPKLRGHDPHGTFRVDIVDEEHPIVRGLESFDTVDELYTCLAGDAKIRLLATSRSKVDGKDYPMAFVLPYGKGRVFHSPLGHDVRAFEAPGVGELFRRACAWAAGLDPVAR